MAVSGHRTYAMLARYTHLRVGGAGGEDGDEGRALASWSAAPMEAGGSHPQHPPTITAQSAGQTMADRPWSPSCRIPGRGARVVAGPTVRSVDPRASRPGRA
jgi:hypothetical protein